MPSVHEEAVLGALGDLALPGVQPALQEPETSSSGVKDNLQVYTDKSYRFTSLYLILNKQVIF